MKKLLFVLSGFLIVGCTSSLDRYDGVDIAYCERTKAQFELDKLKSYTCLNDYVAKYTKKSSGPDAIAEGAMYECGQEVRDFSNSKYEMTSCLVAKERGISVLSFKRMIPYNEEMKRRNDIEGPKKYTLNQVIKFQSGL